MPSRFANFHEFYPFYLSEHANRTSRRLHFIGSSLMVLVVIAVCVTQRWVLLWTLPVIGYGFAWIGHFFFEHNRPATFTYPFYSLAGDWVMWWQTLTGRIKF
ncbi:MAG: Mpo1-like protein [Rudaea sp.]